jgi:hypothetical protein
VPATAAFRRTAKVLTFWQAKTEGAKLSGRKLDASIMTATDDEARSRSTRR